MKHFPWLVYHMPWAYLGPSTHAWNFKCLVFKSELYTILIWSLQSVLSLLVLMRALCAFFIAFFETLDSDFGGLAFLFVAYAIFVYRFSILTPIDGDIFVAV